MISCSVYTFGKPLHVSFTNEDFIMNICGTLYDYNLNDVDGGYRDRQYTREEFIAAVYSWCTADEVEMNVDGVSWTMPTPREIRFMGRKGIEEIADNFWTDMEGVE